MTGLAQARQLNIRARMHEELGNTLLASWMRESAKYVEDITRRTEEMLDEMCLGMYEESSRTRYEDFAHDWYEYEEEYAYNFCGLE